jgi:hypothetical protein
MSSELPDMPAQLAPHKEYLDTLSPADLSTAASFIIANPDCGLDTIKHAVRIKHEAS